MGGTRTHHIMLLDDSFSMSDRWEDTDAFAEAKKVVERIGGEAARQPHPQLLTLLRFSRVGRFQRAAEPDLLKQPVGGETPDKLAELLGRLKVSQTAAGPIPALQAVRPVAGPERRRAAHRLLDLRLPRPPVGSAHAASHRVAAT